VKYRYELSEFYISTNKTGVFPGKETPDYS
jgi:hypothetical protein